MSFPGPLRHSEDMYAVVEPHDSSGLELSFTPLRAQPASARSRGAEQILPGNAILSKDLDTASTAFQDQEQQYISPYTAGAGQAFPAYFSHNAAGISETPFFSQRHEYVSPIEKEFPDPFRGMIDPLLDNPHEKAHTSLTPHQQSNASCEVDDQSEHIDLRLLMPEKLYPSQSQPFWQRASDPENRHHEMDPSFHATSHMMGTRNFHFGSYRNKPKTAPPKYKGPAPKRMTPQVALTYRGDSSYDNPILVDPFLDARGSLDITDFSDDSSETGSDKENVPVNEHSDSPFGNNQPLRLLIGSIADRGVLLGLVAQLNKYEIAKIARGDERTSTEYILQQTKALVKKAIAEYRLKQQTSKLSAAGGFDYDSEARTIQGYSSPHPSHSLEAGLY